MFDWAKQQLAGWQGGSSPVTNSVVTEKPVNPLNPKGLKPCCACPETKSARDECFLRNGDADVKCQQLVEAHMNCMRSLGFDVGPVIKP